MTTQEIEKCLEGLTPSERAKFESYLKERFERCTIEKQVETVENGDLRFDVTIQDIKGVYIKVRCYKYRHEVFTVVYLNGKPKEIHRIM